MNLQFLLKVNRKALFANVKNIISCCKFLRKPVSRYEVIKLQNAMDDMLNKAGLTDIDGDLKGPTQVKCLTCSLILAR